MKYLYLRTFLPKPLHEYHNYWATRIFKRGHFAWDNLDKKLEKYLDFDGGYFVELGANDGFTQSNTLYLELYKKWRGVLIEPSPNLFLSCTHYRNSPGNKIHCCACVPFNYKEKYVDIEYAFLMSVSKNLNLDLENTDSWIEKGKGLFLEDHQENLRFGAPAKTLTSVLDDSEAPNQIDFLSIDVEGAEVDVLMGIDFEKYKFRYILVECRKLKNVESFLNIKNYKMEEQLTWHDYLFTPV